MSANHQSWEDNRPFLTAEQRETLEAALKLKSSSSSAGGGGGGDENGAKAAKKGRGHPSQGRPKKGGAGGKGTWGTYMDTDGPDAIDKRDPNYDSDEDRFFLEERDTYTNVEDYKKDVCAIILEYFEADDVREAAEGLRELGHPHYHHHFVKKVVTLALDRHDREREMASVLISSLYVEVIDADQIAKGYTSLVDSVEDLSLDCPTAVHALALFIARAVVDDTIPPSYVTRLGTRYEGGSKAAEVVKECVSQLAPRHAGERLLRCWGDGASRTADGVKEAMQKLLAEYVAGGDVAEAKRCLHDLNVPFFHHELVKKALVMAVEKRGAEGQLEGLLKDMASTGEIAESQMTKGFCRTADSLEDLSLDNPNARATLAQVVADAKQAGWLEGSYQVGWDGGRPPESVGEEAATAEEEEGLAEFKRGAVATLREYFSSADVMEVAARLRELDAAPHHRHFVKKAVTTAMDRGDREREMVSVLLSSLYPEVVTSDEVAAGLTDLLRAADDLALDIPSAIDMVSLFVARCVVDDVVPPSFLPSVLPDLLDGSLGVDCIRAAGVVLNARHAAERVLRCWGGGACRTVDEIKGAMQKMLEEYVAGGDVAEACRCLRELNVPFFHHELVKKALVMAVEKEGARDRAAALLAALSESGEVSANQAQKGVARVREQLDDLCLDNPNARKGLEAVLALGREQGWLNF